VLFAYFALHCDPCGKNEVRKKPIQNSKGKIKKEENPSSNLEFLI